MASIINPTKVALETFEGFGIDLGGIVQKNAGDLTGTIINKQTSAKTQIKSIIQEKAEDIDRSPKILEKKQEVGKLEIINSFEKLIEITNDKKEIELKFDLERNVRVVKFETGKIDISFNEKLSKNFVRSLTEKLFLIAQYPRPKLHVKTMLGA